MSVSEDNTNTSESSPEFWRRSAFQSDQPTVDKKTKAPYNPAAYKPQDVRSFNIKAIIAFVFICLGLVPIFLPGIATLILGLILGHSALREIKYENMRGRTMALAAVIMGWAIVGFKVLAIILMLTDGSSF